MSLHIIIDGYNFLHTTEMYGIPVAADLQEMREELLDSLVEYKKFKPHKITVVFDGTNAPFFSTKQSSHKGIGVRYSHKGELADDVIKRMAAHERSRAIVVTSDNDIARSANASDASVLGSDEFAEKMKQALFFGDHETGDDFSDDGWVPTTKKKGPGKRLPKKKRKTAKKAKKL